jgi:hypothetical protein
MAIDLEAIRRKLGELSGKNGKQGWKPEEGKEYTVRLMAFPRNDGQPFIDRHYYYGIGNSPGILAPFQFGKPDPIKELRSKLYDEGSTASKEIAKTVAPKMRTFAPVIVRGEEDKGVRIWSFGKMVYQDILNLMLDEDYGDITDPLEGRDIRVSVSKLPGKQFADTKISPRAKVEPLSRDRDQAKKWLDTIPEVDTAANLKSYDEIEKLVNDWINGGSTSSDSGTSRGGDSRSNGSNGGNSNFERGAPDKLAAFDDDDAPPAKQQKKTGVSPKEAEKALKDAFADIEDDGF